MKPMEGMIQAVKDVMNGKIRALDPSTILRKTGDASKVTTAFSKHSSRVLPASGEELDVTMGKILKYLSDLGKVAFNESYKDLFERPLILSGKISNYSTSAAYTMDLFYGMSDDRLNEAWLIIGTGGSESTAGVHGATDFARVYLVVTKIEASSVSDYKGRSFILLQLGSSGSTARYTLTATAATGSHDELITLTIPKGSYAHVNVYDLYSIPANVG